MTHETPPLILQGRPSEKKPPRVEDFDELDKKSIDILVDYMKYVATASGITMGFYARTVSENVALISENIGKAMVFSPILFWFVAILFSVVGVFPRTYQAKTDFEKETAIIKIRVLKSKYSRLSLLFFVIGFLSFVYVIAARLWGFYPFL